MIVVATNLSVSSPDQKYIFEDLLKRRFPKQKVHLERTFYHLDRLDQGRDNLATLVLVEADDLLADLGNV